MCRAEEEGQGMVPSAGPSGQKNAFPSPNRREPQANFLRQNLFSLLWALTLKMFGFHLRALVFLCGHRTPLCKALFGGRHGEPCERLLPPAAFS